MANIRSLWTPGGERPIAEKQVIKIVDPMILRMLSWLHKWANDQDINIFCKKCEKPIYGQNNDSSAIVAVSCQCREWRWAGGRL